MHSRLLQPIFHTEEWFMKRIGLTHVHLHFGRKLQLIHKEYIIFTSFGYAPDAG
jgi:hypothetical protein